MPEPADQRLFALSSAVAKDGLAFIERLLTEKRPIKPYDNWPVISWSEGMPIFTFVCDDPPIDYGDAFRSLWSLLLLLGRRADAKEQFDFEKQDAYQELKRYIRSEPPPAPLVFPPHLHQQAFSAPLQIVLQQAI